MSIQERPACPWSPVLLAALVAAACQRDHSGDGTLPDEPSASLIPAPRALELARGAFELRAGARVVAAPAAAPVAELLATRLREASGFALPLVDEAPIAGDIALAVDADLEATLGREGYVLDVSAIIDLRASTPAGLFYGSQTLRQLFPPEVEGAVAPADGRWPVRHIHIEDWPRFPYRGLMLDVARHFFTVDEVRRLIDLAAYHKLNMLHLHLTDDQGWRIHIDAWPALTTIGGSTQVGGGPGGFYTKADYAALVDYAAARFVTIVPEIEVPGHCQAALSSYAELNPDGIPPPLYTGNECGISALWLEGPATWTFLADVFSEVAAMTPGPYIHIGGDEAPLPADEYQAFISGAHDLVSANGKLTIGWEEIGGVDLGPGFVAQHWRHQDEALAGVAQGALLIASPATHAYLDMQYDPDTPIGCAWAGYVEVDRAYEWDPVFPGITETDVLGLEAAIWTDRVNSIADLDYLVFPRLVGHAEIAWSSTSGRSWEEYRERLAAHGRRLDALGVGYYRSPLIPWGSDKGVPGDTP